MGYTLDPEILERLEELEKRYPSREALMLPALWEVMDREGYISSEAMEAVADFLKVPLSKVYGVVSFYSMFHTEKEGRYRIRICGTLSCELCGASEILSMLMDRLAIGVGETTSDGKITLEEVECLGSCSTAPVMMVDETLHEKLTPERLEEILEELK
jgi:NADH-quinone oxidoreductase subunit E